MAVLSSMFWFPAPDIVDARAAAFLAIERQYVTGAWTVVKIAVTALVPIWFAVPAIARRRRSWLSRVVQ